MDISAKKSKVEDRLLDAVTMEEYTEHPELYANTGTAVEIHQNDKTYLLPHRNGGYVADRPGVYDCGAIVKFNLPSEKEEDKYTGEIIDLADVSSIGELIEKNSKVRNIEREILTSPDSIFTPVISDSDTPVMRGLKEAVIAKQIDLDKYSDRFGDNYPNDKRQFKKDSVTLFMFERMCDCLDLNAEIIIKDKSPDVPNPMGKTITINISGLDEGDNT
ncbi:MAG: hypothetical protein NC548_15795 [Lachnospiraceae bacterium]|nr:hypothetical protein [Lachnospiraceae bacterium]